MPSSTSSFENEPLEVPRRSLLKAGGVALVTSLAAMAGYEGFWRQRGFVPELRDSAELWCSEVERALGLGPRALAIVGSSRFQLGVDPVVLRRSSLDREPVQLAINGSAALPVLRNLASDARFRGVALCEVMPQNFFTPAALDESGVPWLAYRRARPAVGAWETRLRGVVQGKVAAFQPSLDLHVVAKRLALGQGLPKPSYVRMRADRFMAADYSKVDRSRQLRHWVEQARRKRPPSGSQLEQVLAAARDACERIRGRGGRVIFVRMISSLELRAVEDELFPRAPYWDRLLTETNASGIYDTEVPGAATLTCPEGSHLDAEQARKFSAGLARALTVALDPRS